MNSIRNALMAMPVIFGMGSANAEDFTAGVVMEKMSSVERSAYLAGVVEGLAYARFAKEGNEEPGMRCIYQWFYDTEGTVKKIHDAFSRFREHLPGAVIAAMIEKECGA